MSYVRTKINYYLLCIFHRFLVNRLIHYFNYSQITIIQVLVISSRNHRWTPTFEPTRISIRIPGIRVLLGLILNKKNKTFHQNVFTLHIGPEIRLCPEPRKSSGRPCGTWIRYLFVEIILGANFDLGCAKNL